MPLTVVDVVLGSLVLGLAGWALVHAGSGKPAGGGSGGGCASSGCGPAAPRDEDDEPLVKLGGPARDR